MMSILMLGFKGFRSRECKILNLKDCRHQNCWLLPFFYQLTVHFFSLPGGQLEKLMDDLHAELSTNPPLPGSYTARKGDLCAALFVDNNWYVSSFFVSVSIVFNMLKSTTWQWPVMPRLKRLYLFFCLVLPFFVLLMARITVITADTLLSASQLIYYAMYYSLYWTTDCFPFILGWLY